LVPYVAAAPVCRFDQPYAWYPLNGNGNDSVGRFHGSLQGGSGPAAASNRFGVANTALSFDGVDDRIDLGDQFNVGLPFTIAAWVYQPSAARQPGVFRSIFATDDAPNQYFGHFFGLGPAGHLDMSYGNGGPPDTRSRRSIDSNNPIPLDRWVHLVATVRGPTDMTLYIDGSVAPSTFTGTGGPIVHSAAPARIGSFSLVAANTPWLGMMDDVLIYNCSLDAANVTSLFQRQ
jgi:hypothetical protein